MRNRVQGHGNHRGGSTSVRWGRVPPVALWGGGIYLRLQGFRAVVAELNERTGFLGA